MAKWCQHLSWSKDIRTQTRRCFQCGLTVTEQDLVKGTSTGKRSIYVTDRQASQDLGSGASNNAGTYTGAGVRITGGTWASSDSSSGTSAGVNNAVNAYVNYAVTAYSNAIYAAIMGMGTVPSTVTTTTNNARTDLPREKRQEGFRAWKRATISRHKDGLMCTFSGLMQPTRYKADDVAVCIHYDNSVFPSNNPVPLDPSFKCDNPAPLDPSFKCFMCGFYAFKCPAAMNRQFKQRAYQFDPILEVELHGTVMEYELGYRATHQRVLTCWLPDDNFQRGSLSTWSGLLGCECKFGVPPLTCTCGNCNYDNDDGYTIPYP